MQCIPLPCFQDNYVWLIAHEGQAWVVDPGDDAVVEQALTRHGLALAGILVTHHHADHVGGVTALRQRHGVDAWGPAETASVSNRLVIPGQCLQLVGLGDVNVLDVSSHTLGHVAFHLAMPGWLFCGDSLFSAGCGRRFEGSWADFARSLATLSALPAGTLCFPAHEYTESNLRFAQAVEPANPDLADAMARCRELRAKGAPTLPVRLGDELRINPFLRAREPAVASAAATFSGHAHDTRQSVLQALRTWKDGFRG